MVPLFSELFLFVDKLKDVFFPVRQSIDYGQAIVMVKFEM